MRIGQDPELHAISCYTRGIDISEEGWSSLKRDIMIQSLAIMLPAIILIIGCTGGRPANLGVRNGRLSPCPSSPNCVSSQSTDNEHAVEPFPYSSSTPEAMAGLRKIILQMKRTKIVTETNSYLHVECASALWRFVDDVEFSFDGHAKLIQVRSASRLGYSDFSVNRKRVEAIRAAWQASGK
jgi:uncharacterized protein (DUF1499 family)